MGDGFGGSLSINSPIAAVGAGGGDGNTVDSGVVYLLVGHSDCGFRRGDADGSGGINGLTDGLFLLRFQFVPGHPAPPCLDAADVDDNGRVSGLVDGLSLLTGFFAPGAPPIPAPGAFTCGFDPTPDGLSCLVYPCP